MNRFGNLVSTSTLVEETIKLLREHGGRAPVTTVTDLVLQIPGIDLDTAVLLIAELIEDDSRLQLIPTYEIILTNFDSPQRSLFDTDFVVVDVETTGAKTPPNRVTEIGAYRISGNGIVAEFETLVNPQALIPPFIVSLTGITNEMVARAPIFAEIVDEWLNFIGTAVLVAHNAPFDIRFLNHEIERIFPGRRMANSHLDTVRLARRIIPGLPNYRLHTIASHLGITIHNRHRAAGDALATAKIFLHLLEQAEVSGQRSVVSRKQ